MAIIRVKLQKYQGRRKLELETLMKCCSWQFYNTFVPRDGKLPHFLIISAAQFKMPCLNNHFGRVPTVFCIRKLVGESACGWVTCAARQPERKVRDPTPRFVHSRNSESLLRCLGNQQKHAQDCES